MKKDEGCLQILARYELAVAVAYRPKFCRLARELRALETERYTFAKGTGGYLAHLVFPGPTAFLAVRALPQNHARTGLASNTTNTDLHDSSKDCWQGYHLGQHKVVSTQTAQPAELKEQSSAKLPPPPVIVYIINRFYTITRGSCGPGRVKMAIHPKLRPF